jgi:hypothetical protein
MEWFDDAVPSSSEIEAALRVVVVRVPGVARCVSR